MGGRAKAADEYQGSDPSGRRCSERKCDASAMAVPDEDRLFPRQGVGDGENVPGEFEEREASTFTLRNWAQPEPRQIDRGYRGAARQKWNDFRPICHGARVSMNEQALALRHG